jgi:hypothetical protein
MQERLPLEQVARVPRAILSKFGAGKREAPQSQGDWRRRRCRIAMIQRSLETGLRRRPSTALRPDQMLNALRRNPGA